MAGETSRAISSLTALVTRWMNFTKQLDTELLTLRADVMALEQRLDYGITPQAVPDRKPASPVVAAAHRHLALPITPPGQHCDF